jgi:hypothetical protein
MAPPSGALIYTSKQMGDACEMLVAAELTLAGIPALKVPDNWPGYDVIAQPPGSGKPLRISVKARTFKRGADFVVYNVDDTFDWLAIVLLGCEGVRPRRIFVLPREVADSTARKNAETAKTAKERYWRIDEIERTFPAYENNFDLLCVNSPALPPKQELST